ncbi:GyrI-like domain-containing protein [Metabacillus herbersteinensis]|uniref:GyrI-like domain-containing protein n=1 Tax=Metabacillus herbersteinensis TaxID=283816 RepID=A0ABV6GDV4_9BACI
MEGEIVIKKDFSIIELSNNRIYQQPKDTGVISSFWGIIQRGKQEINRYLNEHTLTGICMGECTYIAGVEILARESIPDGVSTHTFPTYTYIRYRHYGSVSTLHNTYSKISEELLLNSDHHSMSDGPWLEVVNTKKYPNPYSENCKLDIYIPIKLGV